MKDSEVTANRNKVIPRERPPLEIEVTKVTKRRFDSSRSGGSFSDMTVEISLPRVRWMERDNER
jgi:hypothetical protein